MPTLNLIHQQTVSFFAVIYRIVELFCYQFVVFDQLMIGIFRKQQRRHVQRVDQQPLMLLVTKKVFGIMIDYVMST